MSIQAMKQVMELYDKHCYNNDYGGIEFNKNHGYKFIEAIEALRTAIQQAEAKTDEPVAWISKTGHGTYFRQSITPELASLEHGGHKMWRPLVYGDTHPAPGVPVGWPTDAEIEMNIWPLLRLRGHEALTLHDCIAAIRAASPAQKG